MEQKAVEKGIMEMRARVYRASTGKWEDLGVICKSSLVQRIKHKLIRLIKKI